MHTVGLDYDVIRPDKSENVPLGPPVVILHGLFGSKRNWQSLGKHYARALKRPVYSMDLRNHGESTHARPHTYEAMAADVLSFLKQRGLKDITMLGHSMGGKVAMALTLNASLPQGMLSKLIVEDIAPAQGTLSMEFRGYIDAMREIEKAKVRTRQQAEKILLHTEQDPSIVGFLLTNLITPKAEEEYARFRIPLDIIADHMDDLGSFPYVPGEAKWEGETLFIKGKNSSYINKRNLPLAEEFFPNSKLSVINAGHWVHVERPMQFNEAVLKFIKDGLSGIHDESGSYLSRR
ncbi:mitochondrial protein [Moniliophthora roreri MCA 2997]|uniref:Mitochondrial protein n=1 Tax=Moniliophthora roreri (strain MCA 2997) TaxID=1381753 RepID=V2X6F8_MONRO|nr:mitochondrial protein [Moniliophthora roreri MCA 2997]